MTKTKLTLELEVFDILPAIPDSDTSSVLVNNVPNIESTIHVFTVPNGNTAFINPGDLTQEAFLEPIDSKGDFINGVINIYAEFSNGEVMRVYSGRSEFHNSRRSPTNRRHWQFGVVLEPGDKIVTKFIASTAMDVKRSHLNHKTAFRTGVNKTRKIKKVKPELKSPYKVEIVEKKERKIWV
jgi:hypothetical protein